ncbi:MAG: MSCRAMM family adhesin SdrC [Clostridiales bacterium]|nr:MSCRAMM family adhesin SdrC [Clostridiales bacterium]
MGKREKKQKKSVLPLVVAAVVFVAIIVALAVALSGSNDAAQTGETDAIADTETENAAESETENETETGTDDEPEEATEPETDTDTEDGESAPSQEEEQETASPDDADGSGETDAQTDTDAQADTDAQTDADSQSAGTDSGTDNAAQTPATTQGTDTTGSSAAVEIDTTISFPYTASEDELKLLAVYSYSGYYIEDGTEDAIDSVAALEVKNTSSQAIEYAVITLTADGETLTFEVSLLPAGGTALVMEADKKSCSETATFTYEGSEIAALDAFDLCESQVSITTDENGAVTVTNVSGADISELRVFYKNQLDTGEYVGGIAYTVKMEDLAAGESQTVYPSHFDPEYGVVMMVRIY